MPRIELIAHRGASRERPENTLASFQRAIELGAHAVELDVHRTIDGLLMVHHDPLISSGPLARRAIASLTRGELAAFRVGGEPMPTLGQVIDLLKPAGLRIYCELKGLHTAELAVKALEPLGDKAAVHSFDHRMVADGQVLAPELPRGVLEAAYHRNPFASMHDVGARDLWQAERLIDKRLIEAVHVQGGRVIAWTVNDPERAEELAAWRIDGICTDDVAGIRAALGR